MSVPKNLGEGDRYHHAAFISRTCACAAMPSPRPAKPSRSVVVEADQAEPIWHVASLTGQRGLTGVGIDVASAAPIQGTGCPHRMAPGTRQVLVPSLQLKPRAPVVEAPGLSRVGEAPIIGQVAAVTGPLKVGVACGVT